MEMKVPVTASTEGDGLAEFGVELCFGYSETDASRDSKLLLFRVEMMKVDYVQSRFSAFEATAGFVGVGPCSFGVACWIFCIRGSTFATVPFGQFMLPFHL